MSSLLSKSKEDTREKIYESFCSKFTSVYGNPPVCMPVITSIDDHPMLRKYFDVFVRESEIFISGVFLVDQLGIYTPIQDTSCGVVCFKKLPFSGQTVFGFYDGYQSVYMKWGKFFVIFPGVRKTNHGYMFIDKNSVQPVPGTQAAIKTYYYEYKNNTDNYSQVDDENDEVAEEETYEMSYYERMRNQMKNMSDNEDDN